MATTTFNGPAYASDWLKGESHSGEFYSRDQIVLASGNGVLISGTVLAKLTASGKYVPAAANRFRRLADRCCNPVRSVGRHNVGRSAGCRNYAAGDSESLGPRLGRNHQQLDASRRGCNAAQGGGHR